MRVTESMGPAWETMKRILFRPFNAGTWFSFGFLFFLQSCVEGGGSNTFRVPNLNGSGSHGRSHGDSGNDVAGIAHDFVKGLAGSGDGFPETGVIVIIAVVAIVVAIPLIILMYWLGTRGQMMSIRSVAMGQANIGEQWNATRQPAGMLLKFELVIAAISLVVFLPLVGGGAVLALPTIRDGVPIENVLPALIGIGVVALLAIIPLTLVGAMARNFVAPIMLKHGIGAREGWKRFWAVGKGHIGGIFVFYLMRILVSIGAGIVGVIAGFFTCCLGFLPVLHQTLMAPWYVFERAWTLEVLASMSPDFDLRSGAAQPPMPYGYGGGNEPPNPYAAQPSDNPYAPPGYGGGGGGGGTGGPPPGGFGGPPPGGFGAP
jgi:hypothetical protein